MPSSLPRPVGPFAVHPIGLGCMNLDHGYGPSVSEEQGARVLLAALDAGYDFFDTATLYGGGANEERLGRVLASRRRRFVLASKCGLEIVGADGQRQQIIDGRPETLRRQCEASLRRLRTEVIDLYYLHRWDRRVPIEDSVGELSRMVERGWVRAIGLSEVSAPTLRRAHAVHPVAAVQSEYSLWTRNPEIAVLDACRELGVAFVAFSPVARGYLSDSPPDPAAFWERDIRRTMPRFAEPNWSANLTLLAPLRALAAELGCTTAQLALSWLLHRAPHLVAIPGTRSEAHLRDNFAAMQLQLDASTLQRLSAMLDGGRVHGERYGEKARREVDTEEAGG